MKKDNIKPPKIIEEKKLSVHPDCRESDFAKTIDGQIMIMTKNATDNKHFIEAQALSWSAITELLIPRLIGWIAKCLKVDLPQEIYKLNCQNLNLLYFCISHDKTLFLKLELARKQRNKIVHNLSQIGDIKQIQKTAARCTQSNLELQKEIIRRFDGTVLIPSINLYKDGWNDAVKKLNQNIKNFLGGS